MEPKDHIDALLGIGSGAEYLSLVVLEPSAKCKCMRHDWGFWWECQVHRRWGGSLLGARAAGMSWQAASQLGLMMNTRGLVALIVLNSGWKAEFYRGPSSP